MDNRVCYPSDQLMVLLSPDIEGAYQAILTSDAPIAFGYAISLGLFGILLAQTFIYHTRFPGDSSWMKAYGEPEDHIMRFYEICGRWAVWFVVLLECLSCALGLWVIWIGSEMHCLSCMVSTVVPLGNDVPDNIMAPPSWIGLSVLTGLISSLVHGFFSWRIWVIGKSLYVPILVMAVSLAQCALVAMGIGAGEGGAGTGGFTYFWLIGSSICDVTITFSTTRWLLKNSHTGFRETHSLVLKLVRLTIETGMVTTVAILLELLLYRFMGNIVYLSVYFSISRLYANCLLATLNARLVISRDSTRVHQVSTALFVADDANSASERHELPVRRRIVGRLSPSPDPDTRAPSPRSSGDLLNVSAAQRAASLSSRDTLSTPFFQAS